MQHSDTSWKIADCDRSFVEVDVHCIMWVLSKIIRALHHWFPDEVLSWNSVGNSPSSISLHQPIVAQVEEPEVEEGFWGCPVCTFDNPHDSSNCDICDTPREEVSEAISSASSPLKETGSML